MRFDINNGLTAYQIITSASISDMTRRFMEYADCTEKRATAIATILYDNKSNPILNTTQ
jgi:16S rRNA C1402 N4-methylase RsmH